MSLVDDHSEQRVHAGFAARCLCGLRLRGAGFGSEPTCPRCRRILDLTDDWATSVSPGEMASRSAIGMGRVIDVLTGRAFVRWARAWFTVPKGIALLTLLLLVSTGWWTWSSYRFRSAVATLEAEFPLAEEALAEGDIDKAIPHVRAAAGAGRVIGAKNPRAMTAVQLERELDGWRRLATTQLDQFLSEQAAAPPAEFEEAFEAAFANRTMIVDGHVTATTALPGDDAIDANQEPSAEYTLDWAWLDETGRQVEFAVAACRALAHIESGSAERVIVAAEIDGVELVSAGGSHWKVRFKPETVTLLTHAGLLRHAGWPEDRELDAVLGQQRQLLGLNE